MSTRALEGRGFLHSLRLDRDKVASFDVYPFSIPAVRHLSELELDPKVTFLVGDNGAGKSTLIEAIAVGAGFNAEGGTKNFNFATRKSESSLHEVLRISRSHRRPTDGFFLRAESFFNVATEVERLGVTGYGEVSLHEQSHGESFLALVMNRFRGNGVYILDEPEAALSPQRQLTLLARMHDLVEHHAAQFVIATHSPILMAYPGALIYALSPTGIRQVDYEDTEHFQITRDFLSNPGSFFKHLFSTER
jgi:predicted ATPase